MTTLANSSFTGLVSDLAGHMRVEGVNFLTERGHPVITPLSGAAHSFEDVATEFVCLGADVWPESVSNGQPVKSKSVPSAAHKARQFFAAVALGVVFALTYLVEPPQAYAIRLSDFAQFSWLDALSAP